MCRRDQILGIALLAFGLGLLVGSWIDTHFWRVFFGIGLTAGGVLVLVKK
ncbi:MAG: hypothetical protein IJV82_04915 [Oscillospiraceae bacterium]|nr:hypothetical protein [Oscillospiraceae bacterium]